MRNRLAFMIAAVLGLGAAGIALATEELPPLEKDAKMRLESSPRHGEWVSISASMGDKVDAWVVYPERKDPAPVVIVIHEIFGLTDWARSVADQLAADGFLAVAPDFLSGKGPDGKGSSSLTPDAARQINSGLQPAEVVSRLNAVADWATRLPAATSKFGVVGYCWGGGISFRYATEQPNLGGAVVYYGVSPDTQALARVRAPVLGLYGGDDARVNATIPAAQEEMKRLGKRYEVEFYDGAGHAFLRQQDARDGANLRAAQNGWARTVQFFKETLAGGMSSLPAQALPAAFVDPLCYCPEEDWSAGVAEAGAAESAAVTAAAALD
jgi:carboxymethylenebutenolidase